MLFGFYAPEDLEAGRQIYESGVRPEKMVPLLQLTAYEMHLRGELKDGLEQIDQAGTGNEATPSAPVRRTRRRQKHLAFDGG